MEAELAALKVEVREFRARMADELRDTRGDIGKLEAALHGPPSESSIRGRLHKLENDEHASRAALAAVEAVKLAQRRTFSTLEKVALFAFAAIATSSTVLRWFGVG